MIIVRYAEIGLKGKNRSSFENILVNNIKACLDSHKIRYEGVKRPFGRIFVLTDDPCLCLQCVFGISTFSSCIAAGFNMEDIKKSALAFAENLGPKKSFRVTCQRLDKSFPLESPKFEAELGAFIQQKTKAKVKMKGFDLNICAEIIDGCVYFFHERIQGPGGLPVGIGGNVLVFVEDESSLLAGLQMMKRGCSIVPIALKQADITLLQKYSFGRRLELKVIKDISEIDVVARETYSKAVIVNDSFDSMRELGLETTVLRPLIAYGPEDIEEELDAFRQRVC